MSSEQTNDQIVVYGLQLTSAKYGMLANFSTMLSHEKNVANAEFCCDAFNVKEETGLTPRQLRERIFELTDQHLVCSKENKELKEQMDELLKAMQEIIDDQDKEYIHQKRRHEAGKRDTLPAIPEWTAKYQKLIKRMTGKQD